MFRFVVMPCRLHIGDMFEEMVVMPSRVQIK